MGKKIAIIGANEPLYSFYKQAYDLGYEIYGFAWEEGAVCKKFCKEFFPINFTEKEKILNICKEIGIDGITSFSLESALPTVIYVAEKLGLKQNTINSLKYIRDKYTMREAMKKNNLPIPEFFCIKEEKELDALKIKYPVIVKPVDNGGKNGVSLITGEKELHKAFNYAMKNSKEGSVLIEKYIEGREFSVEYISFEGKHYFLQLTDKVNTGAPHFVEIEHHQPANVTKLELEKIKNITEKTLTALHITNSVSHTELKINPEGEVYLIEVGPRLGGDSITSDLVRLSTGIDLVLESLKLSTGDFKPIEQQNIAYASKYYYVPGKEWIIDLIKQNRTYIYDVNREIKNEMPLSNGDRSAWVICVNKDKRVNKENYLELE